MVGDSRSGVARGGGPPRVSPFWGDTICCFFSFETENPLIGRQRPFFVFTYFLADKGCHHEIPPQVPPFLATPLDSRPCNDFVPL